MKKGQGIIWFIIGIVLVAGLIGGFLYFDRQNQKSRDISAPIVSPTSEPSPQKSMSPDKDMQELPDGWTRAFDGASNYQFAYPNEWTLRPATSRNGESAVYSFDPEETPDTGGVPVEQLKIAVVYFPEEDEREITFDNIESETELVVDGFNATQYVTSGAMGGSVSTLVEMDQGKYLVSAYPPDSEMLEVYDEFLNYIDLDRSEPVDFVSPELSETVSSPLNINAAAKGNWFFEAQISLSLVTLTGENLVSTTAATREDWMTEELVTFDTEMEFNVPEENYGFVKIEKSNPSGMPQNANSFYWPVEF